MAANAPDCLYVAVNKGWFRLLICFQDLSWGVSDLVPWLRSLKSVDEGNTIIYAHDDSASARLIR